MILNDAIALLREKIRRKVGASNFGERFPQITAGTCINVLGERKGSFNYTFQLYENKTKTGKKK